MMNRWFVVGLFIIALSLCYCPARGMMADPPSQNFGPYRTKVEMWARADTLLFRAGLGLDVLAPSWVIWTMDAGHWDVRDLAWYLFWLDYSLEPTP